MSDTKDDPFSCFGSSDEDSFNEEPQAGSNGNAERTALKGTSSEPMQTAELLHNRSRTRDPSCGLLSFHQNTERSLLAHVQNDVSGKTFIGDHEAADAVLESIDNFCRNRHWMMHVGPQKGAIVASFLDDCLASVTKNHSNQVNCVEIGTYCGYASILLTQRALRSVHRSRASFHMYTVEISESNAAVANSFIQLANLQERISVILLRTGQDLPTELKRAINARDQKPKIDFLFLDHDKDSYLSDLNKLEKSGLIQSETHVAADNVVFARIDAYRNYMHDLVKRKIVTSRLEKSLVEYSEPELSSGINRKALADGVELSVYLKNP